MLGNEDLSTEGILVIQEPGPANRLRKERPTPPAVGQGSRGLVVSSMFRRARRSNQRPWDHHDSRTLPPLRGCEGRFLTPPLSSPDVMSRRGLKKNTRISHVW